MSNNHKKTQEEVSRMILCLSDSRQGSESNEVAIIVLGRRMTLTETRRMMLSGDAQKKALAAAKWLRGEIDDNELKQA